MRFFEVNVEPSRVASITLPVVLFIALAVGYLVTAHVRHLDNPQDRLVPTLSELVDGVRRVAFEPDRNGEYRLLTDTLASVRRFAISLVIVMVVGIGLGLHMGVFPYVERLFLRFVAFIDKPPALAVLPILFIVFGLDEASKVALMVIGVMPTVVLDTYLRAKATPRKLIIKGFTLGASSFEIAYRIVLPQIMPGVLDTIRLNLKAMAVFLIAGESLAAQSGLGYRIFLVRRYVAMDIIIPYVLWISLLLLTADLAFRLWIRWRYKWRD